MPRIRLIALSMSVAIAAMACVSSSSPGFTFPAAPSAPGSSQPATSPSASTAAMSPAASASTSLPSPSASASAAGGPTIDLSEWKVALGATTIKAGKVTFTISNLGAIPHELLAFRSKLDPTAYPTDKTGHIIEDAKSITQVTDGPNLDAGVTETRTIDLSTPGTYLFVCNIPGHFKAGMFIVVTVTK